LGADRGGADGKLYEVAWKVTGADVYGVWNTDSSGNYISNIIGAVSGTSPALESIESSFHQDLNGDGVIGLNLPTTVIEADGSTSLVEVGSNYFLFPVGGSWGPELSYAGAPVVAGQLGAWAPIGAEQTASGYEVAWKLAGADEYGVWDTDSSGNYISNAIGAVSGASAALESIEPSFHQDLNGDGVIGLNLPTTVIQSVGSTSLVEVGSNYFLFAVGGSSGPELSFAGAPIVAGQFGAWAPIGAAQTASGYEVAWKVTGADAYGVWDTDSSGNYISNAIGIVSGASAALKTLEPSFHHDLNRDGVIGPTTIATPIRER
jgi:serralysin